MLPFQLHRVKDEDTVPVKREVSPSNVTYRIPFYLPPVNSSSSSSNSSIPVRRYKDNSEEPYRVPFHLPVPGSSSSSASCCCGSDGSTPLRSNTALTLLQLGHLTSTKSPLQSKLLDYSTPSNPLVVGESVIKNLPFLSSLGYLKGSYLWRTMKLTIVRCTMMTPMRRRYRIRRH
jgi:hypothetical protein